MFTPRDFVLQFIQDESGTVMVGTVVVLPMLFWSYLAMFVYWDSFRSINTVQKAAYTVSDAISRGMIILPDTYFNCLRSLMKFLIDRDQYVKKRIISISYDQAALQFKVFWSYSTGSTLPELTTVTLQEVKNRIPKMSDADFATIVDTEVPYTPAFNVGLSSQTMRQFIITRPRFVAPTCMVGRTCTPV